MSGHASHRFESRLDLPEAARRTSLALLQAQLSDALDLASHLKHAHWNVRGPHFLPLHELFDRLHEELEEQIDEIAERAAALASPVHGTLRQGAAASRLPEYPADLVDGAAHLKALAERYALLAASARAAIDSAADAGDAGTSDLFTQFSRELDKHLWFIEAHLQRSW